MMAIRTWIDPTKIILNLDCTKSWHMFFPLPNTATTTKTAFCPGSIWPFVPVLEPGFGRRDKSAGGFCPGW